MPHAAINLRSWLRIFSKLTWIATWISDTESTHPQEGIMHEYKDESGATQESPATQAPTSDELDELDELDSYGECNCADPECPCGGSKRGTL